MIHVDTTVYVDMLSWTLFISAYVSMWLYRCAKLNDIYKDTCQHNKENEF